MLRGLSCRCYKERVLLIGSDGSLAYLDRFDSRASDATTHLFHEPMGPMSAVVQYVCCGSSGATGATSAVQPAAVLRRLNATARPVKVEVCAQPACVLAEAQAAVAADSGSATADDDAEAEAAARLTGAPRAVASGVKEGVDGGDTLWHALDRLREEAASKPVKAPSRVELEALRAEVVTMFQHTFDRCATACAT